AYFRGVPGPPAAVSLVPTILLLFVFGWSLAVLCGTINVFFQDTQHLAEVFFQVLFYMTPIIYFPSAVEGHPMSWLLNWNPIVPFLTLVRQPLIHGVVPTADQYLFALSIALALAALAGATLG